MTPEQAKTLAADIKRVMELDAKRTQGEWHHIKTYVCDEKTWYDESGVRYGEPPNWVLSLNTSGIEYDKQPETAAFIASAPLMADIIRQQGEVIRKLRVALLAAQAAGDFRGHIGEMAEYTISQALALSAPLVEGNQPTHEWQGAE